MILSVFKIVRFNTVDSVHISFKVQDKHLEEILHSLMDRGVGENFGTIDVFSLIATRPVVDFKGERKDKDRKKHYSISDRMTIEEIQVCGVGRLLSELRISSHNHDLFTHAFIYSDVLSCVLSCLFPLLLL